MERGGALTSNAVLIMLFDATCCLHSFLLFTRVSRGLASTSLIGNIIEKNIIKLS